MTKLKLFVDFWNFQLDWNNLVGKKETGEPIKIPWERELARVLCDAIGRTRGEAVGYAGTHVYASVDPSGDAGLRKFLHRMDSFPGYSVTQKDRLARPGGIHCRACKQQIVDCPLCKKRLRRTVEKGIDAAIITEMVEMGFDGVYDIAVLASNDADLAQATTFIQNRIGKHIYNLWFPGKGDTLRNACWDYLPMPRLLSDLGVGVVDSESTDEGPIR